MDKEGTHKELFIGELFNPKTHPGEKWRRDNLSKKMTAYSNNKVVVDGNTGMIKINKKDFMIPEAVGDMSRKERAYLIAGNLAAVYHNNATAPEATKEGNYIYMGKQPIMSITRNDNAQEILAKLNAVR